MLASDFFLNAHHPAYFNSAGRTKGLKSAQLEAMAWLEKWQEPWAITQGVKVKESDRLRSAFAQLAGYTSEAVAIVPAASYAMAWAALNVGLEPGDDIVILDEEFPSTVYAWQYAAQAKGCSLTTVKHQLTDSLTQKICEAITPKTKVVSVSNVFWKDGRLIDLPAIRQVLGANGWLIADITQGLGVMPFNGPTSGVDVAVCSGYKWLLGPYGVAYAAVSDRCLSWAPLEMPWVNRCNVLALSSQMYDDAFRPGAVKFDAGGKSEDFLLPVASVGLEWVNQHQAQILSQVRDVQRSVLSVLDEFGLPYVVNQALHIVGVPGSSFTLPLSQLESSFKEKGVIVGIRSDCLRLSWYAYTLPDEIQRLKMALRNSLKI